MKILLADDHQIIREGLAALLHKEPDMQVVAQADTGRTAVQLARKHAPDVVVMDVSMPDLNGIEAAKQIRAEMPAVKIIALSMHSDRRFVAQMLKAGASGYLLKDSAFEELTQAIRAILNRRVYLSPKITGIVVDDYVQHLSVSDITNPPALTTREREVVQLMAEGRSTKQIADRLNISVKTVETHRRQLMEKLKLHSVAELTKFAVREGLTSLEP